MNVASIKWAVLGIIILYSGGIAQTNADAPFHAQDFETKGVFELTVNNSTVLKPGSSNITTVSAFATLMKKGLLGYSAGLEIQFFTEPITEEGKADILRNSAKKLRKSDHAALILFLDKDNKIGQANLSYVIPGTTVERTVAWKPEDLKRYFSDCTFDGKRLILKSKGSYSDLESEQERITLSWKMDLDLPVFGEIK